MLGARPGPKRSILERTAVCLPINWIKVSIVAVLATMPLGAPSQAAGDSDLQITVPPVTRQAPPAPAATSVDAATEIPAKTLFGAVRAPAALAARSIGTYAKGCLAGAQTLPADGAEWQAMRLSRNRNWGHPALVSYLERFAADARRLDGWTGLLVGDMSQPRGGPMASGHASHQVGLDADLWFRPMPAKRLTKAERETLSADSVLAPGGLKIDAQQFTAEHVRLLKRAASFGEVERVFVHPAIKKALCEATINDVDRTWLIKMRPIWGHYDHFHVRIRCPEDAVGCQPQAAPPGDDGCGKELDDWFALLRAPPKPDAVPEPPVKPLTLDKLPADCRTVLTAIGQVNAKPLPVK